MFVLQADICRVIICEVSKVAVSVHIYIHTL